MLGIINSSDVPWISKGSQSILLYRKVPFLDEIAGSLRKEKHTVAKPVKKTTGLKLCEHERNSAISSNWYVRLRMYKKSWVYILCYSKWFQKRYLGKGVNHIAPITCLTALIC